jgi:hypothetical protein
VGMTEVRSSRRSQSAMADFRPVYVVMLIASRLVF